MSVCLCVIIRAANHHAPSGGLQCHFPAKSLIHRYYLFKWNYMQKLPSVFCAYACPNLLQRGMQEFVHLPSYMCLAEALDQQSHASNQNSTLPSITFKCCVRLTDEATNRQVFKCISGKADMISSMSYMSSYHIFRICHHV